VEEMSSKVVGGVDGNSLRLTTKLAATVDEVWATLTEHELLARWLAVPSWELIPGSRLQLKFENTGHVNQGRIVQVQEPVLLEYTWEFPDGEETLVRWELHAEPDGCQLVLIHSLPPCADRANLLAGWHTHLEGVPQALAGHYVDFPWGRWEELHRMYAQQEAVTESSQARKP
jgi:uncharacterized protein YndB with AHSA1/START domain